jgi:transcriptional regulator with XRE-family HTH domain
MQFGEALYVLRSRLAMSQSELARSSALSRAYVSAVEKSKRRPPPLSTVERMSVALRLSDAEREVIKHRAVIERACDFADRSVGLTSGCMRIEMTCKL